MTHQLLRFFIVTLLAGLIGCSKESTPSLPHEKSVENIPPQKPANVQINERTAKEVPGAKLGGIGTPENVRAELRDFGIAYHWYFDRKNVGPSSLEDLGKDVLYFPKLAEQIKAGRFIIVWKANLHENAEENDKYLLAYPKDAATNGGWILTGGGLVRQRTADEVKQLSPIRTRDRAQHEQRMSEHRDSQSSSCGTRAHRELLKEHQENKR